MSEIGHRIARTTADLTRHERLAVMQAWYKDKIYEHPELSALYGAASLRLQVPTARIITNRHLGLELTTPPQFRMRDERAQTWLNRILKLNGFRGSMRAAAITKSWAGDVGVLFAYKPNETAIFGTPWQVGFIEPFAYEVHRQYGSGVFREVDVYSYTDRPDELNPQRMVRWWTKTRYSHEWVDTWPPVKGDVALETRPEPAAFDQVLVDEELRRVRNSLGVIPFVVIQNLSDGTHSWEGASDYEYVTHLFHRLNVHLDSVEQGEQIRNRLMMALIDADEIGAETAQGLTVLNIKSKEDGTDDRQAQLVPTPLLGQGGTQLQFFLQLLDLAMESAGVAQTGSVKEVFGNEAASASALRTFYSAQAAVAQAKREHWLGERIDFGLSGLARKLMHAARAVDSKAPFTVETDLDDDEYALSLDWPDMFALSAAEQQTYAAVAQQANDDGLPPEHIAPLWGKVLGASDAAAQKEIADALRKGQERLEAGLLTTPRLSGEQAAGGILGSGQGDGLRPDGGSVTSMNGDAE